MAAFVIFGGFSGGSWRRPLERLKSRILPILVFAAAVIVGLIFAGLYLWVKSGTEPAIGSFLRYQTLFAISGFAMIALSSPTDYWVLLMVVFLLVMLIAASSALWGSKRDRALEAATSLAFTAVGLMLYYFGRSHFFVLRLVAWPGCCLALFIASRAFQISSRAKRSLVAVSLCLVAAVPVGFAFENAVQPEFIYQSMQLQNVSDSVMDDVAMIRKFTSPGEHVVIFGLNSATLYGATDTIPALPGFSYPERLLRSDLTAELKDINERGPEKLFVQFGDKLMKKELFGDRLMEPEWILGSYKVQYSSPTLHYSYLRRRQP